MPLSEKESKMTDDRWSVHRNFYSFARSNGSSDEQNRNDESRSRAMWMARTGREFGAAFAAAKLEQDEDGAD